MKKENSKKVACRRLGKKSIELIEHIHEEYCQAWLSSSRRALANNFPLDCFANFLQFHRDRKSHGGAFDNLLRLEESGIFLEVSVQTSWVIGEPVDHSEWWEESKVI